MVNQTLCSLPDFVKRNFKRAHSTRCYNMSQNNVSRAVVVAQLVEWSLLIPEVRGSNRLIRKLFITFLLSTVLKRRT